MNHMILWLYDRPTTQVLKDKKRAGYALLPAQGNCSPLTKWLWTENKPFNDSASVHAIHLPSTRADLHWSSEHALLRKQGDGKVWLLLLFVVLPGVCAGKKPQLGIIALMQREKPEQYNPVLPLNDKTHIPFPGWIMKVKKKTTNKPKDYAQQLLDSSSPKSMWLWFTWLAHRWQ